MSTVADNKCPSCGANIKFNPQTQKWDCEYCGASYGRETFEQYQEKHQDKIKELDIEIDEYSCPNCGAKVITDENTVATHCVYCGSTAIMKNRIHGVLEPNKLIPFKSVKEDAVKAFTEFVKKKKYAPDAFSKKENIEKVTGVYIPFWLYDCDIKGHISAEAVDTKSWTEGSYDVTQRDIYHCEREGTAVFTDVPVDGSTKFPDDIMDSIEPYDYKEFTSFNYSYLSGFLAEKYDQTEKQVYDRAKIRIENTFSESLKNDIRHGAVTIKEKIFNINKHEVEYALLPVWMLNIKYEDKNYTFAMNGQTKKMIGDVPVDKGKVMKSFFVCLGITTVISACILKFLGII